MVSTAELRLLVGGKDEASSVIKGVDAKVSGLGNTVKRIGEMASGFLVANVITKGAAAITGYVGQAISAASDLQQSVGGVESVYGDAADTIFKFGQMAAQQAGLSKNAFNELASATGAFLKNYGFDADAAAGKTIELTQRAADMAATFGGSVDEAMTAIQAGLRGQADPLERYGVALNAAKVEAHALAMTGKTTTAMLTDQEKMAARLDLVFQQTADSAGQFAREEDTAAGKAERLKAKQENLAAQMGQYLLPIQLKVTEAKMKFAEILSTKVAPAIGKVSEFIGAFIGNIKWLLENGGGIGNIVSGDGGASFFQKLNYAAYQAVKFIRDDFIPAMQKLLPAVIAGLRSAGDYLQGKFLTAWRNLEPVISPVVAALQVLGPALLHLPGAVGAILEKLEPLGVAFDKTFGFIVGNQAALIGALSTISAVILGQLVPATVTWITVEWAKVTALVASAAAFVAANAPMIAVAVAIGALVAGIVLLVKHWDELTEKYPVLKQAQDLAVDAFNAVRDVIMDKVVPAIREATGWINDNIVPALKSIGKFIVTEVLPRIGDFVAKWVEVHLKVGEKIVQIAAFFLTFRDDVVRYVGPIVEKVGSIAAKVIDIHLTVGEKLIAIAGFFLSLRDDVATYVQPVIDKVKDIAFWIVNTSVTISQRVDDMVGFLSNLKNKVFEFLDPIISKIETMKGLWDDVAGIASKVGGGVGAVGDFLGSGGGGGDPRQYFGTTHIGSPQVNFDAAGEWRVPGPRGAGDVVPRWLSPGEMVLPPGLADMVRSGSSGGGAVVFNGPVTINARDKDDALRSTRDVRFALRARGG